MATCIDIMPDISEPDESFYALRACLFFSCMKRAKLNVPESRRRGAQSALWIGEGSFSHLIIGKASWRVACIS